MSTGHGEPVPQGDHHDDEVADAATVSAKKRLAQQYPKRG
jgi:hypothetical protein